ncbi:type I-E CRISPR-associated protein Cas6/Cse3/CasE [Actinotignum sp. GS-2025g]|uniref:type I-E CRISPR-associated protein Cas6/Cse3/CasE n=1 Tax=Actinotignum sp. GS-2025g TaxID=3427280 RepID=UPI003F469261
MADDLTAEPRRVFLTKVPAHSLLSRIALHKPRSGWNIGDHKVRHRAIMALFPQADADRPRAEMGILFRLDHIPGQTPFFLVQSTEPIPALNLPAEALTKEKEIPVLPVGTPVMFRVAVNAVERRGKKVVRTIPQDGAETGAPNTPTLSTWLQKKLDPALHEVAISSAHREVLKSGQGDTFHNLCIDTIDGVAVVGDSAELQRLQLSGVGRAKSYGCGLLSVQVLS